MNRQIAQIKKDSREGRDLGLKIKKFSNQISRSKKLTQANKPQTMLLQQRWDKEMLSSRRRFDAGSSQAAPIQIAHSSILQKSASFSLNAPMEIDAFIFIQTANLEISAQTKVAISNTKARERSHNR
jgi:hypothetical protein|tara:strand:- start:309 stop:689 length:381 start_codon:yes stop_codon:yes gene_type:complete